MYVYLFFNIILSYLLTLYVGKFGVVHKGRLVADDGNFKLVAIKTIKCK